MTNTFSSPAQRIFTCILGLLLFSFHSGSAQSSDVILQGFYWNSHPGDPSDPVNGGIWWDSLAEVSPELAGAGISTIWAPPMTKGFGNLWDMGYGLYEYYDLGEYDQKGSTRTRHGTRAQLDHFLQVAHNHDLKVMADIVLNHRGGGDAQTTYEYNAGPWAGATEYMIFHPASGRFPGEASHFHPNNAHPDQDPDWHDPIFFNDICYFNQSDQIGPPDGWYHGVPPFGLGHAADSLIDWGRWLMEEVGFDEMRIDAVKHIDPAFLAKFLVETAPGEQAFAVGEFFDTNAATLAWYQNTVVDHMNSGDKPAQMSIFDFELRADMQAVLNDGSGGADLFNELGYSGLVWGQGEAGTEVVTFLDNHDKDRIGFIGGSAQVNGECPPGEIKAGNSCLIVAGENAPDHDPIVNDKEDMGYPLLMAAEGRPTIFWKDWFWFDLASEIEWLIPLRGLMATGGSFNSTQAAADGDPSNDPFWDPAFGGNNGGGNLFAMMRWGSTSGTQDGMVLGLNDHPTDSLGMWVSTPFSSRFLKDYSDGFLFEPNQAFLDSRALIRAKGRDYSWWGLTGQYPHPPRIAPAIFSMDAEPGGSVHYVILDRDEVANFQVNGAPLAVGDQVAIRNAAGEICGLGRVGQAFGWSADHDMLIEVLGPFPIDTDPVGGAANGMAVGESFELLVWDASENEVFRASSLSFAAVGTSGTFDALRPQTPGRPAQLTQPLITDASGTFQHAAITRLTAMVADERVDDIPLSLPTPSQTYAPFEVQLRPNPASELVRVQLETQVSASLQLTCLSLTGRTVWEQRLFAPAHQEQEVAFAVQSWPKGVYLLRVSDGDHTHIEKVLVR